MYMYMNCVCIAMYIIQSHSAQHRTRTVTVMSVYKYADAAWLVVTTFKKPFLVSSRLLFLGVVFRGGHLVQAPFLVLARRKLLRHGRRDVLLWE